MALLDLKPLENLNQMKHLDELRNLQNLDKLEHMDQLRHIQGLDKLEHMDKLQHIEGLDKLQKLDQLQHLDKLSNLQALNQLQNLDMLKHMQQLEKLNQLQNMQMLDRLGELEKLNQLQNMHVLTKLDQLNQMKNLQELPALSNLQQMAKLTELQNLQNLQQIEALNRLRVLDRLLNFDFTTLLYLFSVIVPGLVFQETVVLFTRGKIDFKRAMVLMVIYNIVNLLLGVVVLFDFFTQLSAQPVVYYLAWFVMLIAAPIGFGWLLALVAKAPRAERFSELLITKPKHVVANAWERFLTEAESYQIVITLNNAEKIMGFFQKGSPTPATVDPNDLYFTETAHYDPQATTWTDLERPVNVWVKGSEIKMVEVSPQELS